MAFEHAPAPSDSPSSSRSSISTLVFIGGISDGLLTVPYTTPLAACLPPSWRLLQPLLSSSYKGWGVCSLGDDVSELAKLVTYLRNLRPQGHVVFLGHSTGCQDAMHYLSSEGATSRPRIDGAILQAPVSDRDALSRLGDMSEEIGEAEALAREWVEEGKGDDVLPSEHTMYVFGQGSVVSAKRFLSLTSPGPEHAGEDDYFSADFGPERLRTTFGKVGATGKRVQVLIGGADEYVPEAVDKGALLRQWVASLSEGGAVVDAGTAVVKGADHQLVTCDDAVRKDAFKRITDFLEHF